MTIILGIDLGTTSVKVNCFNRSTSEVIKRTSLSYEHHLKSSSFSQFFDGDKFENLIKVGEINPYLILSTLVFCIEKFDLKLRRQIDGIGITGQMHGILLWNKQCLDRIRSTDSNQLHLNLNFDKNYETLLSNLITWQDDRCDKEFLDDLPGNSNFENRKVYSGYGLATIYWLLKNKPNYLDNYCYMGSIMDFVIHVLCTDLKHPVTSNQLANSYGYFDMQTNDWSTDLNENFPKYLLPTVLKDDQLAGRLNYRTMEINAGVPVFVACGDLQCAIYSAMIDKTRTAILNSGTSIQLAFPLISQNELNDESADLLAKLLSDKNLSHELPSSSSDSPSKFNLDVVPYFENGYLVTCSALNGGNVIGFFIKSICKFVTDLFDVELNIDRIWPRISQLAKNYIESKKKSTDGDADELIIHARLFGERHEMIKSKLSISKISATNFELGQIYYSLCSSIIDNVFTMCPIELLKQLDIEQVCSVGTTLQKNEILQECLKLKLAKHNLELTFDSQVEADLGISIITTKNLAKLNQYENLIKTNSNIC